MPLIFDNFPDEGAADAFIAHVERTTDLRGRRWPSQDEMHERFIKSSGSDEFADVFPFQLSGIVVTVTRPVENADEIETPVLESAKRFGGSYAGT